MKLIKKNTFEDSSDIFKGLNPEQAEAVKSINGPLLIVAGAGSGKTRVLTNRIAYFLEQGIPAYSILALTFTNKAANEMKDRISKMVGDAANKIWAGTFHSIFAKILRFEAEKIGFTSNYTIYDTDDSLSLIKSVMNSLHISQQDLTPQQVRTKISNAKNNMLNWKQLHDGSSFSNDKIIAQIFEAYERKLKENNCMDFDDLILNMIKLLESDRSVLEKYQTKFKYIMVDEYQDTNHAQYLVVNLLARAHQNICVVGDDAQSIYGWRGADIGNILNFQNDYPYCKIIRLEQNYRSTKTILAAADSVIKYNRKQIPKKLWTDNPDGDLIELLQFNDSRDEAERIISKIKMAVSKGKSLKEIAVLYRTNAQSAEFENACRKHNIPYVIVGGMSFYKRKEIKDVLAYLKILVNPMDSESLLRIVNEPPRGLGNTSLRHLQNYAEMHNVSLIKSFELAEMNSDLQKRAAVAAKNFAYMIYKHIAAVANAEYDLPTIVSEYLNETGLFDMYREIGTDESRDKLRNIEAVINDIAYFVKNNPDAGLADYVQQISLISELDEKDISQNKLTLMTIHSAKGLEFDEVFIAGLEKGLFPLTRSDADDSELEEERRLFYVAITRAETKLHISYCEQRFRFGNISQQFPSPFIREIDESLIAKKGSPDRPSARPTMGIPKPAKTRSFFDDIPANESYSQLPPPVFNFKIGDTVKHMQFGVGRITGLSGEGNQRKATVLFSVGKKQLMLAYAKLELIRK